MGSAWHEYVRESRSGTWTPSELPVLRTDGDLINLLPRLHHEILNSFGFEKSLRLFHQSLRSVLSGTSCSGPSGRVHPPEDHSDGGVPLQSIFHLGPLGPDMVLYAACFRQGACFVVHSHIVAVVLGQVFPNGQTLDQAPRTGKDTVFSVLPTGLHRHACWLTSRVAAPGNSGTGQMRRTACSVCRGGHQAQVTGRFGRGRRGGRI